MARSIIDSYCLSMEPPMALCLALGDVSRIFIPSDMDGYTGRVFFHSTHYNSSESAQDGARFLIEEGWNPPEQYAPTCAILGYGKIKSIEAYQDSTLFEAEIEKHGISGKYQDFLILNGWTELTPIHVLDIEDQHYLKTPIVAIRHEPDQHISPGTFWLPESPIEMEAMKMALEKDRALAIAEFED